MKLLFICSELDLRLGHATTSGWWQLFKGLSELGHDVIAVPYAGTPIESPWWRVYPNPCEYEGKAYGLVRNLMGQTTMPSGGWGSKVSKTVVDTWIRPRWENHLASLLTKEQGVDAVVFCSIPTHHVKGVPDRLRARFHVPFYYYDGKAPSTLPRFAVDNVERRLYADDCQLGEYEACFSNSQGAAEDLKLLGAKRVETVYWGVDPELYAPLTVDQDRDVLFIGTGAEGRGSWVDAMLVRPSRELSDKQFFAAGKGYAHEMGAVRLLGATPFSRQRNLCCKSRINLNIARDAFAEVPASSTLRLFELAAMGCCIVTNPLAGLDAWFEAGRELVVVHSADEAVDVYRGLLADEAERRSLGEAARRRVLHQHTHRQQANQLVQYLQGT
jgi:glycosyltransferase involved in cell wall biosynthesis